MGLHARFALVAALGAGIAGAHAGDQWHGQVSVIDGDSLDMRGQQIRLFGVDAVEGKQTCRDAKTRRWPCGRRAAHALADFIARQPVNCIERDRDRYGRVVAVCAAPAGEINDWLVRQGWAVAYRRYSNDYVAAEEEAKAAKRNIWGGTFVNPEVFRHHK
jgi:endonuclease YncB( thermonuclease family)